MSLDRVVQNDFSAGMFRAVARDLIPPNGVWDLQNLLLDEDGALYKRGGYVHQVATAPSTKTADGVWHVNTAAGERTLVLVKGGTFATQYSLYVLDAAGTGWVLLAEYSEMPGDVAVVGGIAFLGSVAYGGSRAASPTVAYATGTVAVTAGSDQVTGTGTGWTGTVLPVGTLIQVGPATAAPTGVVSSVESATSLTLTHGFVGPTGTGQAYQAWGALPATEAGLGSGPKLSAGGRLLSLQGNKVYESNGFTTAGAPDPFQEVGYSYIEIPAGGLPISFAAIDNDVMIFTTQGVFVLSNIAYDLTDDYGNPQQSLRRVYPDIQVWGQGALASWQGGVIVAARDAVWLLSQSGPQRLSDSLGQYYRAQATGTQLPGRGTVFNGHYFLPLVGQVLVCRLSHPTEVRGQLVFPWTRITTTPGQTTHFTVKSSATTSGFVTTGTGESRLLAVTGPSPKLQDWTSVFMPSATNRSDADSTTPVASLETRDFTTGDGNLNTIRRARIRYEMEGLTTPTMTGDIATAGETGYRSMARSFADVAPANTAEQPYTWGTAERARRVRLRFQSSSLTTKLVIRGVELFVRSSPKDR